MHFVFDPFGIGDPETGAIRGTIVESYLQQEFGAQFRRIKSRSVVGMAQLFAKAGPGICDYIHIDGDHRFEKVVADFVLADMLCRKGGFIVFDDALYPAIEAVLNYVASNRADYAIAEFPAGNVAVLQRLDGDRRNWDAFEPFDVPRRRGWTKSGND